MLRPFRGPLYVPNVLWGFFSKSVSLGKHGFASTNAIMAMFTINIACYALIFQVYVVRIAAHFDV
jgi:hypothetical protein